MNLNNGTYEGFPPSAPTSTRHVFNDPTLDDSVIDATVMLARQVIHGTSSGVQILNMLTKGEGDNLPISGGGAISAPSTGTHSLAQATGITRTTPHSLRLMNRSATDSVGDHEALPDEDFSNPSVTFRQEIAEKIEETSIHA